MALDEVTFKTELWFLIGFHRTNIKKTGQLDFVFYLHRVEILSRRPNHRVTFVVSKDSFMNN